MLPAATSGAAAGVVRLRAGQKSPKLLETASESEATNERSSPHSYFQTMPALPNSGPEPWLSPANFQPGTTTQVPATTAQNGIARNATNSSLMIIPRRTGPAPIYGLEQRVGEILGTERPETSANLFLPLLYDGAGKIFFADGRAYVTTSGRTGGSVGFGANTYDEFLDRIFGVSGWWNYDDGNARSYQQVGFSINSIGRWFEWSLSGYLPYTRDRFQLSETVDTSNPRFSGNNVVFDRFQVFETAFRGVEAEVGGPMPILGRYGWSGYIGGYFWSSNDDTDAGGFKARFAANVSRDLTMGIEVSNDRLFGTNVFMTARLTYPDSRGWQWFRPKSVRERLTASVPHRHRVVTYQRTVQSEVAAINAVDNEPFQIVFIDPLATGTNVGTFENRFTSLASFNALSENERRGFDVIIVGPGAEPSAPVTGLIGGITLFDNQRLINQNTAATFNTTLGTFTVGAVTPGSALPILSNTSAGATGAVVTLAGSNITVDGFVIDGSTGAPNILTNGILVADGTTASDVTIQNNTIQNTLNGILTLPNGGFGTTADSSFGPNLVVSTNTFTNNSNTIASAGINVTTTGGFNISNSPQISGFRDAVVIRNTGAGTGIFTGNTLVGSADISTGNPASNRGLFLTHTSAGTLNLLVSNNTATDFRGTTIPPFNEDTNNNGILDPAPGNEDLNGNGILDIPAGFVITADGATINANDLANTTQQLGFINNTATANGTGMSLNAINGGVLNAALQANTFDNNVDIFTGFNAKASGTGSVINIGTFADNQIMGNSGNGIFLAAFDGAMLLMDPTEDRDRDRILDPSEDTNGNGLLDAGEDLNGNGMLDASEDVNGNGVLDLGFINTLVTANGTSTDTTATLNGVSVLSAGTNAVSGVASLVRVQIGGGALGQSNGITNNGNIDGTVGGRGIIFAAQGGAALTATVINSTVIGNGLDGILVSSDGTNSTVNMTIGQRNDLTNPFAQLTRAVNLTNNGVLADTNNTLPIAGNAVTILTSNNGIVRGSIVNSDLSGVASASPGFDRGDNIRVVANTGTVDLSTEDTNGDGLLDAGEDRNGNGILDLGIVDNQLVRAAITSATPTGGVNGIFIDATDAAISATIRGNAISEGNLAGATGGAGIRVESDGTGTPSVNLTIGGRNLNDGNVIDQNTIVGVGITLAGNTTSNLSIIGNQVTDTTLSDTTFNGGGIEIELADNAQLLAGSEIDANFIGVDAAGTAGANALGSGIEVTADNSSLVNLLIGNDANGDNGDGNTISNHANGAGITVTRNSSAVITNVRIIDNQLTTNGTGISLNSNGTQNAAADNFTVDFNNISTNTGVGLAASLSVDANMNLNVATNSITNNGLDGIELTETGVVVTNLRRISGTWIGNTITNNTGNGIELSAAVDDLIIGSDDGLNSTLANTISMNTLDGVEINGAGVSTDPIADPAVTLGDNVISLNGVAGVDYNLNSLVDAVFQSVSLLNNTITQNTGDGVEFMSNSNTLASSTTPGATLVADRNTITQNTGRGVDILNQGNNVLSNVMLTNNDISGNMLEAVYVVNTASTTQNQTAASSTALAADGAVTNDARLQFTMSNNMINGNGALGTLTATGLVLRVGTTDAEALTTSVTDDGGFATDGLGNLTRGGVFATVTDNAFSGNTGDEVFIEGFVSTVDPNSTTGTWNVTVFDVTAYEQDPLSRLDLVFTGNTGNTIDITRAGPSFSNVEQVFKSRDTAQNPAGPFAAGGTRLRNAQRLASRAAPFDAPLVSPDLGVFLFPGVGASTFRRSTASNVTGFTGGDNFITIVPLGGGVGELDFIWGSF